MKYLKNYLSLPVFIVFAMLLSMYPYNFYFLLGLPGEAQMVGVFVIVSAIYMFFKHGLNVKLPQIVISCMLLQALAWFLFYIYHSDTSYLTRLVFLLLAFLSICVVVNSNKIEEFMKLYGLWLCLQAICGAIAFVLIFVGFLSPINTYITDESASNIIYSYGLTCSNAVYGNFIRVAGFFDEPGAFATWGVFALIFNKLTFDNRKFEMIMGVLLVFSFSAAYYVLIAMYFVLFYVKSIKKSFINIVLLLVMFGGITYSLQDNDTFRYMTTERFEGGQIRSKRDIAAEAAQKVFQEHMLMGMGARKLQDVGETMADNPYEILAKDGIVGFIFTYLPLVFLLFKYRRKTDVLFSIFILIAAYSQRPFHINEMHYFMIYFLITIIVLKNENKLIID